MSDPLGIQTEVEDLVAIRMADVVCMNGVKNTSLLINEFSLWIMGGHIAIFMAILIQIDTIMEIVSIASIKLFLVFFLLATIFCLAQRAFSTLNISSISGFLEPNGSTEGFNARQKTLFFSRSLEYLHPLSGNRRKLKKMILDERIEAHLDMILPYRYKHISMLALQMISAFMSVASLAYGFFAL